MYEKNVGSHGQFVGMHVSSYKVNYMVGEWARSNYTIITPPIP